MLCDGSSRSSHDLDLISQGQIIDFREFRIQVVIFLNFDMDI
jgi:hypothetical protein